MAFIFGTHPVDNGGIHMAALRSANAGMTSVQIFTAIPKFYGDKSKINPDRVKRFQQTVSTTGSGASIGVPPHGRGVVRTPAVVESSTRAHGRFTRIRVPHSVPVQLTYG